ncbi:MAG: hypothetical protein M0Q92_02620 [Methanoregula sp.]|jgi:hypothetical protein|nr:hypothetical protein [Methanoregula sp.]
MQALQAQPQTSAELAARFGVSDRHIRRTIADLILEKKVSRQRAGRDFLYSLAAAVVEEDAATTTITGSAGTADNCGHNVRDRDLGHTSDTGETIADIRGHDRGHGKPQNSKQRHRITKRTPSMHGPAANGPPCGPGPGPLTPCGDSGTNLCPQFFAGFERDMIQFVLFDKIFRDLLMTRADERGWQVRKVHGLTWIYPMNTLSLQVGKDTVTFYSSEPGDMSVISRWVQDNFAVEYGDIKSLVCRIKYPQNLSSEELTVVVKRPETIQAIRTSIGKSMVNGQFNLQHPSEAIPGLKIYERDSTMRIEFIVHNHKTGAAAVDMREELMRDLPRIHGTPGLFWEFVQKYYSALHHPLIIDTGGHDFLAALDKITGHFTGALRDLAAKIPAAPTGRELQLRELRDAIEALESGELGDIIRTFRDLANIEETPTKVFLAAWVIWNNRHRKGRVNKAEIAGMLMRQNDPLTLAQIADAVDRLKMVGLMDENPKIEICFSAAGREIAEILIAKKEGIQ